MSLGPPCPISTETIVIKPEYLETILRAPESPLLTNNPYPPKVVTLRDKSKLVIRQTRREEAQSILKVIRPYFDEEKDFYDIVAARTYAEILAWYRHRIKDHYLLIGIRNGVLVGLANARLYSDEIAYSLHTMSFAEGVGQSMYFAKVEYAFETLGIKQWWATFESYIGLVHMGLRWGAKSKPWPEFQHELNGARIFYVTADDWGMEKEIFPYLVGERPVPNELLKQAETFESPPFTIE